MNGAALSDRIALAIGAQLANPTGMGGRLIGAVMRLANRRPTRELLKALDIKSSHHVLDVGCGDGSALAALGHAERRCGVDRSETMLEVAARRLRRPREEGRVWLRRGDMRRLPVEANGFDRIIASNLLYFCDDVPAFITECRRVARPGAVLGIYVTAADSMAGWRFAGPQTHRHFTRAQLQHELDRAGVAAADRDIMVVQLPGRIRGLVALVQLAPVT